jgi:Tol biopolymer transport system component
MFRITVFVLLLLLVWGCDGREKPLVEAGPSAAYAAQQSDSSSATTRRVWQPSETFIGITPDGRQVVHTKWDSGNVVIRDFATGATRNLTHNTAAYRPGWGRSPRVSRDGQWVAYRWYPQEEPAAQLRLSHLDGTALRTIYDAKAGTDVQAEDWSPDGRTILAIRTQEDGTKQIVLVPFDSGSARVLKTFDWRQPMRMNFSPDGRFIVYDFPTVESSNLDRDLYVLDLTTGREHRLVQHPANDYVLGWGPDASHVLFASDRSGTRSAWLQKVDNGLPRGEPVLVKADLWNAGVGQFTSDGRFFYHVQSSQRQVHVATLDAASGKAVGVASSLTPSVMGVVSDPQWSPDGRFVSYVEQTNTFNSSAIMVRALETGVVRELHIPHDLKYPQHRWAPDGKSLLIAGLSKGRSGLFRMDMQTAQLEPVFMLDDRAHSIETMEFSGDGRTMVYLRGNVDRFADIVVRDLTSGTERALPHPEKPNFFFRIRLSPSGDMVAFKEGPEDAFRLKVQSLADGTIRQLQNQFDVGGSFTWSADGRSLFVTRPVPNDKLHNELWRLPVDGSPAERVGLASDGMGEIRLDAAGRRLVFSTGQAAGELWVMEHILPRAATAQSNEPTSSH